MGPCANAAHTRF
ncbi:hypothetical protein TIFTF001_017759 [Ficus carica]|uniref:Uncharacterized protein n=1 Tax=Ficus carica TaxID=3494 RepID=A0AA88AR93_FICCA|nr:hypothetical protein TIFTF001_017759 [Ficus carica]